MKNQIQRHLRALPTFWLKVVASVASVALLTGALAFGAQNQQAVKVVPLDQFVYGMNYGEWTAAWWQYVLALPTDTTHPILDTSGTYCTNGQSSAPVFFLVGAATTDLVERNCTLPAGKHLVFPLINWECSTLEPSPFFGNNGQELRTCASAFANGVDPKSLKVEVDNAVIPNLMLFRVQSPVYDVLNLPTPNFLGVNGGNSGFSVSDGYWVILNPLAPGNHKIHFEAAETGGWSQNVTYNLTVQNENITASEGNVTFPNIALAGSTKIDGEQEFEEHCAACHPNGGNIVNPKKTLATKVLQANGIKRWQDIVAIMRKPGPGMTPFIALAIPDPEARAIAQYILRAF